MTIACKVPAQITGGAKAIQVTTAGGASNTDITYTYNDLIIQSVTATSCPTTPTFAKDSRDDHYYAIAKLADNKCWMLTNLAYGGSEAGVQFIDGTGSKDATTTSASSTYWDRTNPPYNNQKQWLDPTNNDVPLYGTGSTRCDAAFRDTASIDYTECGYLYSWCAALGNASASCSASSGNVSNAGGGLCPSGWRLPTGSSSGEFQAMYSAIGGTPASLGGISSTWRGVYSGSFNPGNGLYLQSINGQYWSATASSNTSASYLNFSSSTVGTNDIAKYNGLAVRCVLN
jgi:uncharacterized protein (TIGR02145 family)